VNPAAQLAPAPLRGIDVSWCQGAIDWAAVECDLVYLRATDGLRTIDARFGENARGCRVPWGAYGVIEPYGAAQARAQAQHFLDVLGDAGASLPPALDFELGKGHGARDLLLAARLWLDAVEDALGAPALVYTYPSFFADLVRLLPQDGAADLDAIATRPLWIAHYGVERPTIPAPWGEELGHQYSSRGTVAGIVGPVDLSRWRAIPGAAEE
jgi:lysozyme